MNNLWRVFILIMLLGSQQTAFSQNTDSSRIRISLLTCSPGEELYSIFGHSALRIIDSNNVTDLVYNYGTFDFDDKDFYLKFARGKLLYFVSLERTDDFLFFYTETGRSIKEQVLNLTYAEKKEIQSALNENLKEENRFYKYDFFLDNCTTRLRDIIKKHKHPTPQFPYVMPEKIRFRQAIHQYLEKGDKSWSQLGIDLVLGLPTDKIMTAEEQEFLPDNLMKAVDSCHNTSLVAQKSTLYEPMEFLNKNKGLSPMMTFSLFALIALLVSLSKNKVAISVTNVFDKFLFLITGLLGVILIFMWTMTDHSMTKNNLNLIWALPINIAAVFFTKSENKFFKKYFLYYSFLMLLLLLTWFVLPQELNNALIPIVVLVMYRSFKCYKSISQPKQ